MSPTKTALIDLIAIDRRHEEYPVSDYIAYCENIREAIHSLPRDFNDRGVINFFENDFVPEMEILARICKHQFRGDYAGITVQYLRNDPPDGIITLASSEKVFIECTSAVDRRWESFALEQYRRHGRPFSLSGFEGADIKGNRAAGYSVKGMDINDPAAAEYFVEADEDIEIINRQRKQIANAIEKKLDMPWGSGVNWLAIFVNEMIVLGGD